MLRLNKVIALRMGAGHGMSTFGGPQLLHEPVCVCFPIEKPLKCGPYCHKADSLFGAVLRTILLAQEKAVMCLGNSGETGTNQN